MLTKFKMIFYINYNGLNIIRFMNCQVLVTIPSIISIITGLNENSQKTNLKGQTNHIFQAKFLNSNPVFKLAEITAHK